MVRAMCHVNQFVGRDMVFFFCDESLRGAVGGVLRKDAE